MMFIFLIYIFDLSQLHSRVSQLENMQCDNAYQYKEDQR